MSRRLLTLTLGLAAMLVPCATAQAQGRAWEGRLEIRHSDNFRADRSSTRYDLVTPGRRIRVRPTSAPRIADGTRVVVRGRRIGSRTVKGSVRARSAGVRASVAPGARRTAVLLFNFAADTRQPWTPDQVRASVFTSASSTNAFYKEQSYDTVSLTGRDRPDGDVYGWYTIGASTSGCNVDAWSAQARAAAEAGGADLSGYDHILYVFPRRSGCGWTGQGEMPGDESWINGDISVRVVAHELGHNLGVHHASTLRCWDPAGARTTISGSCSLSEYGDPFDVMGTGSRRSSGWRLQQLGFLKSWNVQTATAGGTYTVNSTIAPSAGSQLLRVPRVGTNDWYYLDFRTAGGVFDNYSLTDPVVKGVGIRLNPDPSVVTQSRLLDANPGSSTFNDAPLPVGRTFTDGRISVTTTAISGTTATVSVQFLDVVAPTVPGLSVVPSETGAALSWAPASDDRGVAGYRVMRDDKLIATVTGLTYRDASVSAGASYTYKVVAFDAAGNATSSQPVRVTIPTPPPPPPPNAGPSIRIRTPTPNQRVNRLLEVRSTAVDKNVVVDMELWIDGVKRKASGGYTLNVALNMTKMPAGDHVAEIRAFDAKGGKSSKSVKFRIVRETTAAKKKRLAAKRRAAAKRKAVARKKAAAKRRANARRATR